MHGPILVSTVGATSDDPQVETDMDAASGGVWENDDIDVVGGVDRAVSQ